MGKLFEGIRESWALRRRISFLEGKVRKLEMLLLPTEEVQNRVYEEHAKELLRVVARTEKPWKDVSALRGLLSPFGMEIHRLRPIDGYDGLLDYVAVWIGTRKSQLNPLLSVLKHVGDRKRTFELSMKPYKVERRTAIYQFCVLLAQLGIFSKYHHSKTSKKITIEVARNRAYFHFFTGAWFERWVRFVINDILTDLRAASSEEIYSFSNIEVKFVDGSIREIDMMVSLNSHVYWIECKSGGFMNYRPRFKSSLEESGRTGDTHILIHTSKSRRKVAKAQAHHGMLPIHIDDARATLRKMWEEHIAGECEEENASPVKLHESSDRSIPAQGCVPPTKPVQSARREASVHHEDLIRPVQVPDSADSTQAGSPALAAPVVLPEPPVLPVPPARKRRGKHALIQD